MTRQLPEPPQLFARFDSDNNSDGAARERFEQFVTDLIAVQWVDATTVAAKNHNDWGIDTFVGDLGGGGVQVWQSKYVLEWQGKSPQSQVRKSFDSAATKAKEKKYRIVEWTLVVPAILHPEQMRWFQGWAQRTQRATKTRIKIWQGDMLRRRLMSSEAFDVRREYFPHTIASMLSQTISAPDVALTENYSLFEDALFVRQLQAAGYSETSAACGMYFATEALRRDLEAKESVSELRALRTIQLDVHGIWEMRFNEQAPAASTDGKMTALYSTVITEAAVVPDTAGLVLQRAHKQGAVHMLVEQQKAGWVKDWRMVAADHAANRVEADAPMQPSSNETKASLGASRVDNSELLGPNRLPSEPTDCLATTE
ncbi:hypothetical protein [Arthrobacter sp. TWP1-1]|uniref:hypothetical protein n=1 Tax=Arthrobacter sp. TWP1-1 TaxID=2804568 RepID=UPI003CECE087